MRGQMRRCQVLDACFGGLSGAELIAPMTRKLTVRSMPGITTSSSTLPVSVPCWGPFSAARKESESPRTCVVSVTAAWVFCLSTHLPRFAWIPSRWRRESSFGLAERIAPSLGCPSIPRKCSVLATFSYPATSRACRYDGTLLKTRAYAKSRLSL